MAEQQRTEIATGYVVDRVVICDAYREPNQHYQLLAGGRSKLVPGRRSSTRYLVSAKSRKGGIAGVVGKEASLFEDLVASEEQLNATVNRMREDVAAWRGQGYPGTARVTRRLLEWWFERDEERRLEGTRLFFCQREAIETVIYLFEARRRFVMPATDDLVRYALKLATGTGKTVVMALVVVWSTLHRRKVTNSPLSANFLVLVPNLTVRDRVWGTDPLTRWPTSPGLNIDSPENLYDQFKLVPTEYAPDFHPSVTVRNWQSIPLELMRDDWIPDDMPEQGRFVPASVLWALRRRERADPHAAARRLLGNWKDLVILNDEAHHVYGEKKVQGTNEPGTVVWSKILTAIRQSAQVSLIVDVSATPWYGSGSTKPDGTLFEWLVSDFSVYDAFESGLVKVVRLPEPGMDGSQYLDLWNMVAGARTKDEYLSACKGAIASIYAGWKTLYLEWEQTLPILRPGPPPVLLVVADRAERAKWLFEHLTTDFELLRNQASADPSTWVTIQVDSKVFNADKGTEGVLRQMVSTVGKPDKIGANVRCIVSVNMLSEGWDVKNVTHIIGLRAFGSPLLTEQVVGRGLRRVDYSALNIPIEERLKNPNRPDEETVDAFGIPFVGFPVERRKRARIKGWQVTSARIACLPERAGFAVEMPNVRSWAVGVSRPLVEIVDVGKLPLLELDPRETPESVQVKAVVGGASETVVSLAEFRREYPVLHSKLLIASELTNRLTGEPTNLETGPTFDEVFEVVAQYIDTRIATVERDGQSSALEDIGIVYWRQKVLDVLETATRGAPTDAQSVPIFGSPRVLSTSSVPEFRWPGVLADGRKTQWSAVPCHTDLEAAFARYCDTAQDIDRYAKNERLGFSVTFYENRRPHQYFPDFLVFASGTAAGNWIVETKGEVHPNTRLKSQAAELWCDRMTRSGLGDWRYLFVQQIPFERAVRTGLRTFNELVDALARG